MFRRLCYNVNKVVENLVERYTEYCDHRVHRVHRDEVKLGITNMFEHALS